MTTTAKRERRARAVYRVCFELEIDIGPADAEEEAPADETIEAAVTGMLDERIVSLARPKFHDATGITAEFMDVRR
jgi:hypothetical protein